MDITLTLKCNNDCIFCPRKGYLKTIACGSLKEAYRDIEKTRRISDKITLSGGEVTILENLLDIMGFCNTKDFREVGIITNGRQLKNEEFAEKLIRAGVKDFAVSLYSFNNKIHDSITQQQGSARDSKRGLLNLRRLSHRYPINIRVNIVLNYWNHRDLPGTLKALFSYGVRNFIIAEQVIINKSSKYLSLEEVKSSLRELRTLDLKNTRLCLKSFPFCFLEDICLARKESLILKEKDPFIILERQEVNTLVKEKDRKDKYLADFRRLFTKIKRCQYCVLERQCMGIQKAYFKRC